MKSKIILALAIFLLVATPFAVAEEKLLHEISGTRVTCEGCDLYDNLKVSSRSCSGEPCNFYFYRQGQKIASFRIKDAILKFYEDSGYPKTLIAAKDTSLDFKQNINGYYHSMSRLDEIQFLKNKINKFQLKFNGKPYKNQKGEIIAREICDKEFPALAGDIDNKIKRFSMFDIQRIQQKENSNKYDCEISYFNLYNVVDYKHEKKSYEYNCGDITFHALGSNINGLDCLPKAKHTTDNTRLTQSKLYCPDGDPMCKKSYFWFDAHGTEIKDPLFVTLAGLPATNSYKINFKEIISYKDDKWDANVKSLATDEFDIGGMHYNVKNSEKVYFIEKNAPTLYIKEGFEVKIKALKSEVIMKFLPEFTSSKTKSEFKGYILLFENPKMHIPTKVYPNGINIKGMKPIKTKTTTYYGIKPTIRYTGGYYNVKLNNGKIARLPYKIIYEFRIDAGQMLKASKGTGVETKSCEDEEDCLLKANKKCVKFDKITAAKGTSLDKFVIANLFENQNVKWDDLNKEQKLKVQQSMSEIIKLNAKSGEDLSDCLSYKCSEKVEVYNSISKKNNVRVWSQKKGLITKGDMINVPCGFSEVKGKVTVYKTEQSKVKEKVKAKRKKYTRSSTCSKLGGTCINFGFIAQQSKTGIIDTKAYCQKTKGRDYTIRKNLCPGPKYVLCCVKKEKVSKYKNKLSKSGLEKKLYSAGNSILKELFRSSTSNEDTIESEDTIDNP